MGPRPPGIRLGTLTSDEIAREEPERPLDSVFGRLRVGVDPLPFAAWRIEAVRCARINLDLDIAAVLAAPSHKRGAALVRHLLISRAVKDQSRSVGPERIVVELTFQTARRIENQRGANPVSAVRDVVLRVSSDILAIAALPPFDQPCRPIRSGITSGRDRR